MNHNQRVGRLGEALALRCLTDRGLTILDQNWRCPRGEIDIVACHESTLVFCEVKTRSSAAFGSPAEAITPVKAARLKSLGLLWLAEFGGSWRTLRFDVLSVTLSASGPAEIRHLRGVL